VLPCRQVINKQLLDAIIARPFCNLEWGLLIESTRFISPVARNLGACGKSCVFRSPLQKQSNHLPVFECDSTRQWAQVTLTP
jgi:hypothetical protein